MELKTLTLDILSKILGKTPDSVAELLFKKSEDGQLTDEIAEGAGATIATLHAEHLKTIEPDVSKEVLDKIHRDAKFDAMSKKEIAIKKKYGVDGKDLDEVIDNAVKAASNDAGSDDRVLIHPLHTSLKAKYDADMEAIAAKHEAELAEVKGQAEKRERFAAKLPTIEAEMLAAGVVMPKNPIAAAKLKSVFLAEFATLDFETNADGVTYLKDANGKLVTDQHKHPVTLQVFTQSKVADYFDIEVQPSRQAPGNDPARPPAPATWNKDNAPKTQEDFYRVFPTIPVAQKQEFLDAFTAASQ